MNIIGSQVPSRIKKIYNTNTFRIGHMTSESYPNVLSVGYCLKSHIFCDPFIVYSKWEVKKRACICMVTENVNVRVCLSNYSNITTILYIISLAKRIMFLFLNEIKGSNFIYITCTSLQVSTLYWIYLTIKYA